MDNSTDILYYEYMIENTIEDRKIMELIFSSEYNNICLKESTEELAIYEANVFKTIIDFIVNLFQKVIDFVKSLIEKITGRLLFKTDHKLIEACNQKIKNMTREERDNVRIMNINIVDAVKDNVTWARIQYQVMDKYLNICIAGTNAFLANKSRDGKNNIPDDQYEKFKSGVNSCNAMIDEKSDIKKIKQNAKNMDFADVRKILDLYATSEELMKSLNAGFKKIIGEMRRNQKIMNDRIKANRETFINRPYNQKELTKYRNLIQYVTNIIIRLCKFQMNMSVLEFRNYETILRRFLGAQNPDVEVDPNHNYNPKLIGTAEI